MEGHEHQWTDPSSFVSVYRVFFPLRSASGHVINTERLKQEAAVQDVCLSAGRDSLNSRAAALNPLQELAQHHAS